MGCRLYLYRKSCGGSGVSWKLGEPAIRMKRGMEMRASLVGTKIQGVGINLAIIFVLSYCTRYSHAVNRMGAVCSLSFKSGRSCSPSSRLVGSH